MKNVIAYSLWGENPIYWKGALRNIELAKSHFPGWTCRFYISSDSRKELVEAIKGENVEVVMVDPVCSGMFWRFWASIDPEVDIFLSRDCDSRISERETAAVREWLDSGKDFHIMRDHPYHTVPILGGMWGSRNGIMKGVGLEKMIEDWTEQTKGKQAAYGIDQDFLAAKIYPIVANMSMEHSEFGLSFGGQTRPFPSRRVDYEFVGDVFDENEKRHPDYWQIIKRSMGN